MPIFFITKMWIGFLKCWISLVFAYFSGERATKDEERERKMDLLTIEPIEPVPEALPTAIKAHMPDEAELEQKRQASPEHQANRTPSMANIVAEAMSAAADAAASLKSGPAPATPKKTKAALEVPTEKEGAAAGSQKEGGGSGETGALLDKPTANGPTSKVQQRHERHGPLNLTLDLSVTTNLSDLTLGQRSNVAGNLAAHSTNTANHAGNLVLGSNQSNVLPLSEPLSGARAGRADHYDYHSTHGHNGAAQSPAAAHMLTADLCSPCSSAPRDPQPRDSRDPSGPRAVSAIVTGSPHLPTPSYTNTTCLTQHLPTPSLTPDHLHHHHHLCHVRPCMQSNTTFLASYLTVNQHAGQIICLREIIQDYSNFRNLIKKGESDSLLYDTLFAFISIKI